VTALYVRDLGRMAYATALAIQRETAERVIAGEDEPNALLLVEHDPVITVSQRRESARHLLAPPEVLRKLGIDVQPTDRGGDITYHGPGQLVAYPIVRLDGFGLNLSRYMRLLEQVTIDTLAAFGVEAFREAGATGVWVSSPDRSAKPQAVKICALGVRIRRGVTMHGLALNVTTDLSHFQTIVPCGLVGRAVTSLAALGVTVSMDEVKSRLVEHFERSLAAAFTESR
jgi:lipoyl(octanoyl) transferase